MLLEISFWKSFQYYLCRLLRILKIMRMKSLEERFNLRNIKAPIAKKKEEYWCVCFYDQKLPYQKCCALLWLKIPLINKVHGIVQWMCCHKQFKTGRVYNQIFRTFQPQCSTMNILRLTGLFTIMFWRNKFVADNYFDTKYHSIIAVINDLNIHALFFFQMKENELDRRDGQKTYT